MTAADPAKKLLSLVKRLKTRYEEPTDLAAPAWEGVEGVLAQVVFSQLLGDAPSPLARGAFDKVRSAFVDLNELRIALPDEIAEVIGETYPNCRERTERIKATLLDVYQREHTMSLAMLTDAGKRECRLYLESLNGVTPFVVARVKLLCLDGTSVPVDDRLLERLKLEHAVEADASTDSASEWLPKQLEPGQSHLVHGLFQAWLDDDSASARPAKPERPKKPKEKNDPAKPEARKSKKAKAS